MYWYYVYKWRRDGETEWKETMDVFHGNFENLILSALSQPENWVVVYTKQISKQSYERLFGVLG